MPGIHLHPHDILDEGVEAIMRRLENMGGIDRVFVEVNTIFERNPYPIGELPHNPVHRVVMGTGTLHAKLPEARGRLSQRVDPSILAGQDPLRQIKEETQGGPVEVIPWVNVLNGDFIGDVESNQVVDFRGNPVEHWLCPNAPDVLNLWQETFSGLRETYGYTTYLIDRIRFPDWAGKSVSPRGLFTCFCPHCQRQMKKQNINVDALVQTLHQLVEKLRQGDYESVVDSLLQDPALPEWQAFRQQSITRFVSALRESVSGQNGELNLWLDLWPPAYSWILGQNYGELTRHSSALKHFPYHRLGGGADVQGLIEYFAKTPEAQNAAFKAFMRLFNLPYDIDYQSFKNDGFPIEFVRQQNDRVREQSQPGTFIYSGIQMWNLGPEELLEAVGAAEQSACDDLLYYCYGWATEDLFHAVGSRRPRR